MNSYVLTVQTPSSNPLSSPDLLFQDNGTHTHTYDDCLQTQKDLPSQFLSSSSSLSASIIIASFSTSAGYNAPAFDLSLTLDPSIPIPQVEKPLRYGKLPEIRHIFRPEPKSPNVVISLVFLVAVLVTVPALVSAVCSLPSSLLVFFCAFSFPLLSPLNKSHLLITSKWLYLGFNLSHLPLAFSNAPVSHALFLGSIAGIEGVFFLYYTSWNLFQTLPVLLALGVVAFLSGSKALTEVQERRLAGLR